MGYATTIYGVHLDALKSAIGSRDEQLRERAIDATRPEPSVDMPTALFLADGGIVWNGVPLAPEALRVELGKLEPGGGLRIRATDLRTGNFMDKAKVSAAIMPMLQEAAFAGKFGFQWEEPYKDSDEFPLADAISDLINGKFSTKDEDHTYQYRYALERICLAIGEHLGTLEGELLLRHLKLKTPLSKKKMPVRLPASDDDVPEISYLTCDEVRDEDIRLQSQDLSYPADAGIENGRREYATILSAASKRGLAIVAFGY